MKELYSVGADIGGTFTDLIAVTGDGNIVAEKVLTTHEDHSDALIAGIELLSSGDVGFMRRLAHATTLASNTLLEKSGAKIALVITAGHEDVLELRRLRRPNLYDRRWLKPEPLVPRELCFPVRERTRSDGSVLSTPSPDELNPIHEQLASIPGLEIVVVGFLNSYANGRNEDLVASHIEERLGDSITVLTSHEILNELGEYERISTAVVNGYVLPTIQSYLKKLGPGLSEIGYDGAPFVMQSNGGLVPAQRAMAQPVRMIESGPVAGVVAASALADRCKIMKMVTLDMGGTTAKTSTIVEGRPRETNEYEVGVSRLGAGRLFGGAGYVARVPSIDIAEVGSGGGSIAYVDQDGLIQVGPESAGSEPGPVCYGLGGTRPTVTDANVVLGYLDPGSFAADGLKVQPEQAAVALRAQVADPVGLELEEAALFVHEIASSNMIRAIRSVTVEVGLDPQEFTLVAFGGAGPLHAAEIAKQLGIELVIIPPLAGVFSAVGLLSSDLHYDEVEPILLETSRADPQGIQQSIEKLVTRLRASIESDGLAVSAEDFRLTFDMKFKGQTGDLSVGWPAGLTFDEKALGKLDSIFTEYFESTYHYVPTAGIPVIINVRCRYQVPVAQLPSLRQPPNESSTDHRTIRSTRQIYTASEGWATVPVFQGRHVLASNDTVNMISGPAIIEEADTTVYVPIGCNVALDEQWNIRIELEDVG